jgi:hypothetical protein
MVGFHDRSLRADGTVIAVTNRGGDDALINEEGDGTTRRLVRGSPRADRHAR